MVTSGKVFPIRRLPHTNQSREKGVWDALLACLPACLGTHPRLPGGHSVHLLSETASLKDGAGDPGVTGFPDKWILSVPCSGLTSLSCLPP